MQQGFGNKQACRIVGINDKTGRRWRNGRNAEPQAQGATTSSTDGAAFWSRPGTCGSTSGPTSLTVCGRKLRSGGSPLS
ncbi:hypothetical protein ACFXIY_10215 [Streptomyces albidoflavus]